MRIKAIVESGDNDKCTLIDSILGSADKARSTSRSSGASSGPRSSGNASSGSRTSRGTSSGPYSSRGASSGPNTSRSGSSNNGANSSRQSGEQQNSQNSQSSTNQRSSSGSSNNGRQTGGTQTGQQSKASSSNKDSDTITFSTGTLKKVLDGKKEPKRHEAFYNLYEYEFTKNNGDKCIIYSENTFEELSKPDIKNKVESYLLDSYSLRYAASYDVQNEDSRYGYVGSIEKSYHGEYSYYKDSSLITKLRNRQMSKKNLNFTIAMDDVNTQKTITLRDGRKLYGYRLFDGNKPEDPGKELYIEDDPIKLSQKMENLKKKGFTHAEMMYVFDMALQEAYDFSTVSMGAQFGYAGSLGDDGKFTVSNQIVRELRGRVKAIAARKEFLTLAGKEGKILDELRNSGR